MSVISDAFKYWPRSKFGQSVRIAVRELALQLTDTADPADSMQIHPVSGAPDDSDGRANGTLAMRSSGKLYVKRSGAYKAVITDGAGGNDFGTAGILTDKIVNSTANTGIDVDETLNTAGIGFWQTLTYNLATGSPLGLQGEFVQGVDRTSGQASAVAAINTSRAGDSGGTYVDFLARAPVDGGGAVTHTAFKVEAGHDRLLDISAAATGDSGIYIGDNLANALQIREGANSYLRFVTTDNAEAIERGVPMHPGSANVDRITDPGDAGNIPVTRSGCVPLTVGGGAETRLIAAPTFIGQRIMVVIDVIGAGTVAVTSASDFDSNGNDTATFNTLGEHIVLEGAQVGGALRWRLVSNEGAVLS